MAHDERGLACADRLGTHDFVGSGVLQHAVLVDAGLVREGVGADDGLLGGTTMPVRTLTKRLVRTSWGGVDARLQAEQRLAGLQRHHHLFQ